MPRTLAAALLLILLATGCAAPREVFDLDRLSPDAQLALSPDGQTLVVAWDGRAPKTEARLVSFSGDRITAVQALSLPDDVFNIAYGRSKDELVLTTLDKQQASRLLRVDLGTGAPRLLHASTARMGFPLEMGEDDHVFLEADQPGDRYGRWRRLQGQQKTVLHDGLYGRAAPLSLVQGALFLGHPTQPLSFQPLLGELPPGLAALVDRTTFLIRCADTRPLTCARWHLHFPPLGGSFGTLEVFTGNRRCKVAGQWADFRETVISRDGGTVVFHAIADKREGSRAIYRVRNEAARCTAQQLQFAPMSGDAAARR